MHHCVQDISAAMAKPSGKVSRLDTSLTMWRQVAAAHLP